MSTIDLDTRSAQDFFEDAVNLAKIYCPDWKLPNTWPSKTAPSVAEIGADPGLALLKLFSYLIGYLADVENGIPFRWQAAFYRFLDASLRTAAPAFAPIQFTLAGGQPSRTVPAESAVLDTTTQTIRFETDEDLRVIPARIDTVLSMVPSLDGYIDCQAAWQGSKTAPIFACAQSTVGASAEVMPLAHWLLVGDPVFFEYDPSVTSVEISLGGWHLDPDYFKYWCDASLVSFDGVVIESSDDRCSLSVRILGPLREATEAQSAAQMNGSLVAQSGFGSASDAVSDAADPAVTMPAYWLLARPADSVRILPGADILPTVKTLVFTVSAQGTLPQQTAANQSLLDLSNGGYPFGKSPAREDAFYVRCDKAFAYSNGAITLDFVLADAATTASAKIDWQYWDGTENEWTAFIDDSGINRYRLQDGTRNLSRSGAVSFMCPVIGKQTVAGNEGYWIRAVLKAFDGSNGYGFQALAPVINDLPAEVLPADYKWPVINYLVQQTKVSFLSRYQSTQATKGPFVISLKIDYTLTKKPNWMWRHNAFQLDRLAPEEGKAHPYLPLPDMPTTLYVGFACENVALQWVGEQASLYFEIENERAGDGPVLYWEWLDAGARRWWPLSVEDRTAKLARSASVRFFVPDAMRQAICLSRQACWLRVSGAPETEPIRITGIYINTTGAFNVRTYTQVILGSSNGLPDQRYLLPFAGIHELQVGEALEARNVGAQADIELQVNEPPALDGNLQPENADLPVAVDWRCVESFVGAGPASRIYTVEGRSGTVTFGNGVQGMIPPAGVQNIIVKRYRTTDGDKGNVLAGTLGLFAAGIPGIAQVSNPVAARGGVNGESVADLVKGAPSRVRANNHAITLCDLKGLAEQASARVCRAVAIPRMAADDSTVTSHYVELVVLAKSDESRARTAPSVLDDVLSYVQARSPIQMQSRITVKSPKFKDIDLYAIFTTNKPRYQWKDLETTISTALTTFLHPVHGGLDADGWQFGMPVPCMDVATFLRSLEGVVDVRVVTLCGEHFQVTLDDDELPTPGSIALTIEGG